MSNRTKVFLAIIGASALWATSGLAKILVRTFDPFTAAFFRFFVAMIVIYPFFLMDKKHRKKTSFLSLLLLGIASTGNITFYYLALRTTTANTAMMIYNVTPLVIALAAPRLIGESVSAKKLLGIFLGLVGTTFIALLPMIEGGGTSFSGDLVGNLFVVGAVASWTIYTIGSRYMLTTKRATPLQLTMASIFTSNLIFGPIAVFLWKSSYMAAILTPINLLIIIHLGIFVTVATYFLYQWAIKHSSATTASFNQYLQPVIAIVFNTVLLGERLTIGFIFGSVVVMIGVFLATGGSLRKLLRPSIPPKR